ncbi:hypothetical protein ABUW04_13025 [Streptacidiphilus sp. N1-10]|uniref:Uncharacterized protein n=1 Tax=Streptacidiphilus jeojiensis TaxID=3229225 RepID=A0ABV6XLT5_9ACTN
MLRRIVALLLALTAGSAGISTASPTYAAGRTAPAAYQSLASAATGNAFADEPPSRIADTRTQTYGNFGKVGPKGVLTLQLPQWISNIPGYAHAKAAVLNVTVTNATTSSYLTAYAAGSARPTTSVLNFASGQTVSSLITVPLGTDDTLNLYNATGSVDVIVDEEGLFVPAGTDYTDVLTPMTPTRLVDTRSQLGTTHGALGANGSLTFKASGIAGLPDATDTHELILNVTAVNPTKGGYLTVYNDGVPKPTVSQLSFAAHETRSNMVIAQAGADGTVTISNETGTTDVVVDVVGYFSNGFNRGTYGLFTGSAPTRLLDTRAGVGATKAPLGAGSVLRLKVAGVHGVPSNATAVLMALTETGATAGGYLTAYPGGTSRPLASTLNFRAGTTVPNLALIPIGADGTVAIYNYAGKVNVVGDLSGYFTN